MLITVKQVQILTFVFRASSEDSISAAIAFIHTEHVDPTNIHWPMAIDFAKYVFASALIDFAARGLHRSPTPLSNDLCQCVN